MADTRNAAEALFRTIADSIMCSEDGKAVLLELAWRSMTPEEQRELTVLMVEQIKNHSGKVVDTAMIYAKAEGVSRSKGAVTYSGLLVPLISTAVKEAWAGMGMEARLTALLETAMTDILASIPERIATKIEAMAVAHIRQHFAHKRLVLPGVDMALGDLLKE